MDTKEKKKKVQSMERQKPWHLFLSRKKSAPRQKQRETWRPKQDILFPDGFWLQRFPCKVEEPPQLPPNRHILEYQTGILIPYRDVHVHVGWRKAPTQSQSFVKLPGARSRYVRRKVKRKVRRPTHKRRKKKVCFMGKHKCSFEWVLLKFTF